MRKLIERKTPKQLDAWDSIYAQIVPKSDKKAGGLSSNNVGVDYDMNIIAYCEDGTKDYDFVKKVAEKNNLKTKEKKSTMKVKKTVMDKEKGKKVEKEVDVPCTIVTVYMPEESK